MNFRLGVNFALRHYHGRGAKSFDDRADVGAHRRTGQKDRHFALFRMFFERLTDRGDEVLQSAWRHRQLFVLALAGERFGECLLPIGGQGNKWDIAGGGGVFVADLARQPRPNMLGDVGQILGIAKRFGNPLEDGRQIAN